ncbi:MAG TPA: hypothetical protein VEQ10_09670 [Vicinamibacteria bacterium]|nr:hypothetical protein [Vicinamibacteria bacterium]
MAALAGCRGRGETFLTYFNGDHGVSVRYAASWRTDQAEQDGVWYRYFLAPPPGPDNRAPVSVTLLAGATANSVDDYAQSYLAAHTVSSSRPEDREGVPGKSWVFASSDGKTAYRLLLVSRGGRVAGLYAQGDAVAVEKNTPILDEMWSSFTIERPDQYPVHSWRSFDASLGVPGSWRETRQFSGRGTLLVQFASPPLLLDKRETVNAALSVTLEPVPEGGGLREYYESTRRKLGENYQVTSHQAFRGGYVDVMRTETPVAVSFIKRYYYAEAGRGCSLSFEAREDAFPRASRWADYIASTLRFGNATGGTAAVAPITVTPAASPAAGSAPR